MSDKAKLDEFEKELGIALPQEIIGLLTVPRELEFYGYPNVESFTALESLLADMPPRMIPCLSQLCGDAVCLYYARQLHSPLVVFFTLGEARVIPQTMDAEKYFRDPDLCAPDHPDNEDEVPQDSNEAWQELLMNDEAEQPELELLKPLCLNSTLEAETDIKRLARLTRRFGEVDGKSSNNVQHIIRGHYRDDLLLLDRGWWIGLAELFVDAGLPLAAIQALENCESVHSIHPYYGNVTHRNNPMRWNDILDVIRRMDALLSVHGDALEKRTVSKKLEIVSGYVAE